MAAGLFPGDWIAEGWLFQYTVFHYCRGIQREMSLQQSDPSMGPQLCGGTTSVPGTLMSSELRVSEAELETSPSAGQEEEEEKECCPLWELFVSLIMWSPNISNLDLKSIGLWSKIMVLIFKTMGFSFKKCFKLFAFGIVFWIVSICLSHVFSHNYLWKEMFLAQNFPGSKLFQAENFNILLELLRNRSWKNCITNMWRLKIKVSTSVFVWKFCPWSFQLWHMSDHMEQSYCSACRRKLKGSMRFLPGSQIICFCEKSPFCWEMLGGFKE